MVVDILLENIENALPVTKEDLMYQSPTSRTPSPSRNQRFTVWNVWRPPGLDWISVAPGTVRSIW